MASNRTHTVSGGGGLELHVEETGNPAGQPILFIHGFSQCGLAWKRQLESDLARDFRLVAMDMRGHGRSQKPRDAYGDSRLWADDVHAIIQTLRLDRPILVGWSYGGVVISDYVSQYGEDAIAATNWVAAISRLGDPLVQSGYLGAEFLALVPGLFTENAEESVAALEKLLRLCVHGEISPEDLYFFLGYNVVVPPHVRVGLFSRTLDHDALVRSMRKPMLLSYGQRDPIVLPAFGQYLESIVPHARLSLYPDASHALFWEESDRFNRELRELAVSARAASARAAATVR